MVKLPTHPVSNEIQGDKGTEIRGSEKTSEKLSEKTSEKILRILKQSPEMTIGQSSSAIGITTRSIERNLKKLKETGRLRRVGPDKGGRWEVQDD